MPLHEHLDPVQILAGFHLIFDGGFGLLRIRPLANLSKLAVD
jgi:hypothetical protein